MADGFAVLAFLRLLLPPPPPKTERVRANEREMEEDRSALLLSSRLDAAAACEEMDSYRVRVESESPACPQGFHTSNFP